MALKGIGIITPHVTHISELAVACALPCNQSDQIKKIPEIPDISARDLRRTSRLCAYALYAATQALGSVRGSKERIDCFAALTHGSTPLLKEFHDYLFDFGADKASPGAFSASVTNAVVATLSTMLCPGGAGTTFVGMEQCGIDALNHAALMISSGASNFALVGATEEYSEIVEQAYSACGWGGRISPLTLPFAQKKGTDYGVGQTEGSVYLFIGPISSIGKNDACLCTIEPLEDPENFSGQVDCIISGANAGPADCYELAILKSVLKAQKRPVPVIFPQLYFGNGFALNGMLDIAVAYDIIGRGSLYPLYPVNPDISQLTAPLLNPLTCKSSLVISAGRNGQAAGAIVRRCDE